MRFPDAIRLYQQGKHAEALEICTRILRREPTNEQVLAMHGTVCALLGKRVDAIATFSRASRIYPKSAPFHYMLGNLQREAGQVSQAVEHYRQAVSLQEKFTDAWINLGLSLQSLDQHESSIECYKKALSLDSMNALALYNLGNCFQDRGRWQEAIDCYEKLLKSRPSDINSIFNLGNANLASGQVLRALQCFEQVGQLSPSHVQALANGGLALYRLGRLRDAENRLQQALGFDKENIAALITAGNVCSALEKNESAIEYFNRAIQLDPYCADAFFNMGNLLYREKQFERASEALEQACDIRAGVPAYMGSLLGVKAALWDVASVERIWLDLMMIWNEGKRVPCDVILESTDDPFVQRQCASMHAAEISLRNAPKERFDSGPDWQPRNRLRIAYLSPDFGDHPVGLSMVEVIEKHDRAKFEVIGLSLCNHPKGAVRDRIEVACEQYHDLSILDIEHSIELVRSLRLDLLIDLAGYTAGGRPALLAARVAIVQASYLGYAGTQAASWMDYIIADHYVVRDIDIESYAEKVVRLPSCFFPTDTTVHLPDKIGSREDEGLPSNAIVFCCFNNAKRITKTMMETWLHLLQRVDNSVLWLQKGNAVACRNMKAFANQHGIDPDRLIFARFEADRALHIARHRLADLYLDTFPYNSHSTARDALLAGLPVLTCSGRSFASRVAGSMLSSLQLPQLIVEDMAAYKDRALELTQTSSKLLEIRAQLSSPAVSQRLFHTTRQVAELERAYAAMIEHRC
jgi:protein O-GlcNAc transferase